MMEDIIRKLERNNVLLVAPMGWGKAECQTTLGAKIAERLAKEGKRVGYIAPTLTLIDKKWGLLWSQLDVSIVATAGASQLCARGHKFYPQRYCHRCPLQRMPPEGFTPPAKLHYSWLKVNLPEDICPYWVQEGLLLRYPIVLGHYGRLRKIRGIDVLIIDEIHEFVVPEVRQFDLSQIRERYEIDTSSIETLKESVDLLLSAHDDEELWILYDILGRSEVVWMEGNVVYSASLRNMPRDVRILGLTATPPPGWPPELWEMIEVKPEKKPVAYIFDQYEWQYDRLDELDASYYLAELLRWAGASAGFRVAIFATASRRDLLESIMQRYGDTVTVFDAWGRFRLGVDLLDYDMSIVLWPSLHISVRRYMRSRGLDPNIAELVNAVQLSGRIRPTDEKKVVFAGARFGRYWDYLSQFYELKELKL